MKKIAVIGSGSWGTALAVMLDKYGHDVTIWSWKEEEATRIREDGEHKEFLPGVPIRKEIKIVTSEKEAVKDAEIVIAAVPSKFVRTNIMKFVPFLNEKQIIVNVAKGLEDNSLNTLAEVIEDCVPQCEVAVLSGPSHAEEVGRGVPTAAVIACKNEKTAKMIQHEFSNPVFRLYTNTDVVGVEIGAAMKNIIALAAGMSDGLGYGDNTKAALMTRGMAEITRLGVAMGGERKTFYGLSGMGDLIVTCTSMHSRNRRAGILLGQGKSLSETLEEVHMVVEGVNTAKAANELAKKYNVSMPITEAINGVLFDGTDVRTVVYDLMMRNKKSEK
ncbi:MAG: NAD(P)H-dependent glycerol-3-phosphate dehydrogenase [Candidatus Metalachnospira sp.]|nr:NAD(P)H-dependent glycerol-3-phosphate dehydrogenase [Candidatus Metalachnospira sp.]